MTDFWHSHTFVSLSSLLHVIEGNNWADPFKIIGISNKERNSVMSNTQLLISLCQLLTSDSLVSDPPVETSCIWLINSCVLLISEFRYYQRNYEPLQYHQQQSCPPKCLYTPVLFRTSMPSSWWTPRTLMEDCVVTSRVSSSPTTLIKTGTSTMTGTSYWLTALKKVCIHVMNSYSVSVYLAMYYY